MTIVAAVIPPEGPLAEVGSFRVAGRTRVNVLSTSDALDALGGSGGAPLLDHALMCSEGGGRKCDENREDENCCLHRISVCEYEEV